MLRVKDHFIREFQYVTQVAHTLDPMPVVIASCTNTSNKVEGAVTA